MMLRPNGSGKNERQAQIQTDINLNHKKEQTSKAIFVRLYLPVFEMDSRDFESLWPYRYLSKISNQSWTYTHNNKTKQKKKGERGEKNERSWTVVLTLSIFVYTTLPHFYFTKCFLYY